MPCSTQPKGDRLVGTKCLVKEMPFSVRSCTFFRADAMIGVRQCCKSIGAHACKRRIISRRISLLGSRENALSIKAVSTRINSRGSLALNCMSASSCRRPGNGEYQYAECNYGPMKDWFSNRTLSSRIKAERGMRLAHCTSITIIGLHMFKIPNAALHVLQPAPKPCKAGLVETCLVCKEGYWPNRLTPSHL